MAQSETISPAVSASVSTNRSLGRFAFVLMLVGGLLVVWLYGSGSRLLNPSSLNGMVPNTGIHSVFTSPAEISIISLFALIAAVWVAHKRKNSRLNIPL